MLGGGRHLATRGSALAALLLAVACSAGSDDGDSGGLAGRSPAENGTTRGTTAEGDDPATTTTAALSWAADVVEVQEYEVPAGSRPHDVAVAEDGTVWYTAQESGELGRLAPATGEITEVALGAGARPHGVIVGPDGAPWVTDGGLNAIVRVDPATSQVRAWPLPPGIGDDANLNTAVFDAAGTLWFTGQSGLYGRLAAGAADVEVFAAPRGEGPYGIAATPDGGVWYASLAGNHLARVDPRTAEATVLEPPTPQQGTRRVWQDGAGRLWTSQWNAGQVAVYDPASDEWREWRLPGDAPQAYAVYVADDEGVWLSDFGSNSLVRFDPAAERFTSYALPSQPAEVRQIHGRTGEVWGAESAADKLVVVRAGTTG
jgi:virginiamycin B lyase